MLRKIITDNTTPSSSTGNLIGFDFLPNPELDQAEYEGVYQKNINNKSRVSKSDLGQS